MYYFAIDSKFKLQSFLTVGTAAEPTAGECHIFPSSGIAGITLFTVTCSHFHDPYGENALFYDCYERYEGDQNGLGNNILVLFFFFCNY